MNTSTIRTRWAAVGAAIAVSLGAGGIGITHATTSSGERPVYIPLEEPCRLADIRPAPNTVGPRTAPLGPDEIYTLDGWGTEGDCTLPTGTAGLALNVTALGATTSTNLRFFAGGTSVPSTANLNPQPNAAPTPNAVDVSLAGSDGTFSVFNKFGNVSVVIDVMGVYDENNHDDRYYQKSEVDTALADKLSTPDRLPAHALEFDPLTAGTTWTKTTFVQTHTASGSIECIGVHVDAPIGSTISSMSTRYIAPNASTDINSTMLVWKTEATDSSPLTDIAVTLINDTQTVPQTVGSALDVVTATPTTPYVVQPGDRVLMAVCTMDDLTLWAATVGLS